MRSAANANRAAAVKWLGRVVMVVGSALKRIRNCLGASAGGVSFFERPGCRKFSCGDYYLAGDSVSPAHQPSDRRCFHSSVGWKIPTGVMRPVINSAGVTSNPGLRAPLAGSATRT